MHGAIRNFDVLCEPVAGAGNMDFYIVGPTKDPGLARIAIEAKKADNPKLLHGLRVQLPEYMSRIGTDRGIFLTYWLKSPAYPHPAQESYAALEQEVLHKIDRPKGVRTVSIDLSIGLPPSQQPA
jgi:hypothetical protein